MLTDYFKFLKAKNLTIIYSFSKCVDDIIVTQYLSNFMPKISDLRKMWFQQFDLIRRNMDHHTLSSFVTFNDKTLNVR